jgi:hypothetical protein
LSFFTASVSFTLHLLRHRGDAADGAVDGIDAMARQALNGLNNNDQGVDASGAAAAGTWQPQVAPRQIRVGQASGAFAQLCKQG